MSNNINARLNKSRVELRDRQTQTRGYISRFEPLALCPCLLLEGFSLSISTKKIILNARGRYKPIDLCTRIRHLANAQSKYTSTLFS